MYPTVSHIGHLTSTVRPLAGFGLTGAAFLSARESTSNGSSLSADFSGSGSGGRERAAPAAGFPGPAPDDGPFDGAGAPDFEGPAAGFPGADGFGAGFALGFPDIEAPQNGQSSSSSSRTEALQDGQVRNSMADAFWETSCPVGRIPGR